MTFHQMLAKLKAVSLKLYLLGTMITLGSLLKIAEIMCKSPMSVTCNVQIPLQITHRIVCKVFCLLHAFYFFPVGEL